MSQILWTTLPVSIDNSGNGYVSVLVTPKLDASVTIVRASVILDRSDAMLPDPSAVAVHAERVIGPWSPERVTWRTAPAVQDIGSPRTVIGPTGPTETRVDVTALARRWIAHDAADHGAVIVAENEVPEGEVFVLAAISDAPLLPPRLELYLR